MDVMCVAHKLAHFVKLLSVAGAIKTSAYEIFRNKCVGKVFSGILTTMRRVMAMNKSNNLVFI